MAGINPFRYSNPVGPEDLIDRDRERRGIVDLAWSSNNCRVVAPRRYGKTSLLRAVLAEAGRQGWVPVYVDFFGVLTTGDVAARIERAYQDQLSGALRRWFDTLRRTWRPVATLGGGAVPASLQVSPSAPAPPLLERLELPQRISERSGQRVLVVFDEFQDVMTAGNADALIRSVIQHHGEVGAYVFSGSQVGMMERLFTDKRRAFYAQTKAVALPPLDPVDVGEFVAGRFEVSGRSVGEALGPLLDAAQGHPQRSMLMAHELWERTPAGTTATTEGWFEALDAVMADYTDEGRTIWDRLEPAQRQVLASVVYNRAGLYSKASGNPPGGATARAVSSLVAEGEIMADSIAPTGYRVVDPLLAEWLKTNRLGRGGQ